MNKKVAKSVVFSYSVLYDIVRSAIEQNKPDLTKKNEISIFNSIVNNIKKHKESHNA